MIRTLMLVMFVASFTTVSAQKKADPVGTWTYVADEAPYEYSTGEIVVEKEGKEYKVEMRLGDYYKSKGEKVNYEKNVLSFRVYVEGESVDIKATMEKDEFEGTASYSDGTIPITGKKK